MFTEIYGTLNMGGEEGVSFLNEFIKRLRRYSDDSSNWSSGVEGVWSWSGRVADLESNIAVTINPENIKAYFEHPDCIEESHKEELMQIRRRLILPGYSRSQGILRPGLQLELLDISGADDDVWKFIEGELLGLYFEAREKTGEELPLPKYLRDYQEGIRDVGVAVV
jgi:hypothetical protein